MDLRIRRKEKGGNWDLYVSNLQDGEQITDVFTYDLIEGKYYKLTDFAGPDSAPTWDCLGSNISFTSLSSGNLDLYSVPWMGGEINYITNNPSSDKWPEWSPSKEPA